MRARGLTALESCQGAGVLRRLASKGLRLTRPGISIAMSCYIEMPLRLGENGRNLHVEALAAYQA